jgi:hypothetical protein
MHRRRPLAVVEMPGEILVSQVRPRVDFAIFCSFLANFGLDTANLFCCFLM